MFLHRIAALVLCCFIVLSGQALAWKASKPVGFVQAAQGTVAAVSENKARVLEDGDPLYLGEILAVIGAGKCQVLFHDGGFLVMSGPAVAKVNDFAHVWGNKDPENNHMRYALGPGLFRIDCGQILAKNHSGMSASTPVGDVELDGNIVLLEIAQQGFGDALSDVLQRMPASAGELTELFETSARQPAAMRVAYQSGSDTRPLTVRADGGTQQIGFRTGYVFGEGQPVLMEEPMSYAPWSRLERFTDVDVPQAYSIMLGDDYGGAGGGSDGGDAGCGC